MSVEEEVKSIVVEQLKVDAETVKGEASFTDDLGADSLDVVQLVMAFEEKFKISIPDDEAEKIRTVGDAVSYVNEKNPGS
jgi:acyl carrier protein